MTCRVQLSPHAVREYRKLDPSVRTQVQAGLDTLQRAPAAGLNVQRLKGRLRAYGRFRAGDDRILYTADSRARMVWVDYIQHRRGVYRGR